MHSIKRGYADMASAEHGDLTTDTASIIDLTRYFLRMTRGQQLITRVEPLPAISEPKPHG